MGNCCEVEIVECGKYFMKGKLVSEDSIIKIAKPLPAKQGQVTGELVKTSGEDSCCGDDGDSCCGSGSETKKKKGIDFYDIAYGSLICLSLLFIGRLAWRNFKR